SRRSGSTSGARPARRWSPAAGIRYPAWRTMRRAAPPLSSHAVTWRLGSRREDEAARRAGGSRPPAPDTRCYCALLFIALDGFAAGLSSGAATSQPRALITSSADLYVLSGSVSSNHFLSSALTPLTWDTTSSLVAGYFCLVISARSLLCSFSLA